MYNVDWGALLPSIKLSYLYANSEPMGYDLHDERDRAIVGLNDRIAGQIGLVKIDRAVQY